MSDMIENGGFPKAELGLVPAAFFCSYGFGQFFSGLLGDRVSPKLLVFTGVLGSSLLNLAFPFCSSVPLMAAIWFVNGLAQSLVWAPMARLIACLLYTSRQFLHNLQHFADHLRIKGARRLVKKHHVRLHRQSADNRNALLLAAGKLSRISVRLLRKTDALQKLHRLLISLLLRLEFETDRRKSDILFYGQVRKKVEMLEHHAHLLTQSINVNTRLIDLCPLKPNLAACGHLEKIQTAQKGTFTDVYKRQGVGWSGITRIE